MATKREIAVEFRNDAGKGASRRLRRAGKVPAIVYGGGIDPRAIEIDHTQLLHVSQNEWFYSTILDLSVKGDVQKVLLRDLQRHPFKSQILHVDFQRVSETEEVRLKVPLHFVGQEKSPAGKTSGVVITHELNDVQVLCLPKHLPEFIEVDLSELPVGGVVHMSDIKLPEGVKLAGLRPGHKESDLAVAIAREVKEEVEIAAPAAEAAPAGKAGAKAAAKGAAPAKAAAPAKSGGKK
jgi:large subunit ribosomal protein L25